MDVLDNPLVLAAVVVVVGGYVIVRRSVGEPLNVRDLSVPPLVLLALGVREVARGDALTVGQLYGLVGVGVLAVVLGGLRAMTVRFYLREGVLWYRYRLLTYAVWVATALVGVAARLATYAVTDLPASAQTLYLSVGLTLAGESLVLAARGLLSGERFAAEGRDAEATKRVIHDEMRARFRRD
ncbi:DUF1453 domain-containing protein [Georgenia subflava]|uniref:DUF1453 domain-containing protein n=1 Tax=Georgenia subflava TaxID=1622177 RepID=A0A6N7EEM1_9MICO|nr:DUF1453 domain-containing protein [Georgenia subflava]MPV35633.1 DUF1453 domain-containing protein [Georgenia subflava]